MWAASAAAIACCSAKLRNRFEDRKAPLMGVLGAFVFAAQMINFYIPGTGSSGHLGGGLLLAILLGPTAAFLTIASVLVVQAMFFADGGLLALGCNIFNVGFIPAFLVYPLFYSRLIGTTPSPTRFRAVTVLSAIAALQLGSLAVVLETAASGISSLPFSTFLLLMQPIHLPIGLVEGLITVAVVSLLRQARADTVPALNTGPIRYSSRKTLAAFLACAVITAGGISSFASKSPDGLEWSIAKATGGAELQQPQHWLHRALASLQAKTVLPAHENSTSSAADEKRENSSAARPAVKPGGNLAAVVGTLSTLLLVIFMGFLLRKRNHRAC